MAAGYPDGEITETAPELSYVEEMHACLTFVCKLQATSIDEKISITCVSFPECQICMLARVQRQVT